MDITVSQQQGRLPVTIFHLKGDIDGSNYDQIQSQIEQAANAGAKDVVLDLTGVPYMSSAGIRLLSSTFQRLRGNLPQESDEAMKHGIRDGTFKSPHLKLVNPTPRVLEVLKMSGLDMLFDVQPSVAAAVASF